MHSTIPFPTFADLAADIAAALVVLQQLETSDAVHVYRPVGGSEWLVWCPELGHSGERLPLAVWVGRQLAARRYIP